MTRSKKNIGINNRNRIKNIKTRFIKVSIVCVLLCSNIPVNAADLTINVDTASFIRTIPETMYGGSLTAWFGFENGYNTTFNNLMLASSQTYIRWPGGSWGDCHLWSDMEGPSGAYTWKVSYNETLYMLGILDATMQPIVNFPGYWYDTLYGHEASLTAAVAWVTDQSSRTPTAQYWEIGNETFGSWEAGWFDGISGTYYGDYFADFYTAMKAVNPDIKIGAVAIPYDSYEPWFYDGLWTRDLLNAAYTNGVVPDFLSIHSYPGTNEGASYNPTLLIDDIDEIEVMTNNLNDMISDTIGPEYVGQIEYCMTEWNSGGVSYDPCHPEEPYYERWRLYSGALFLSQYLMEMAKHGWAGSNSFGDFFYQDWMELPYPQFYVFPDWYAYPFFINRFGRDMVETTSSSSTVRAYASMDDESNLTIFIVNNSAYTDMTAQVNISGLNVCPDGQSWVIEPAGTVPGGGTVQDVEDLQINGIFHPDPLTLNSLSPAAFIASNTFEIILPKSCMMFLKMPASSIEHYGDWTGDNVVDINDLSQFSEIWLDNDCNCPGPDMNGDCIINSYEFSLMARNWLEEIQ